MNYDNELFIANELENGELEISQYFGENIEEVWIPEEIEGKKVTKIGDGIFKENKTVKSLHMPNSIEEIGDEAFYDTDITEFYFSNQLKTIGSLAFRRIETDELVLPDSIEQLHPKAFQTLCVKKINIPKNCTIIPFECFRVAKIESIVIPKQIKEIQEDAFAKCNMLTSLNIEEGVEMIADGAFACCEKLVNVELPKSVKRIGNEIFCNCENLEKVFLPSSIQEIGEDIFYGAYKAVIYTQKDSIAMQYAIEHEIPYVLIDQQPDQIIGARENEKEDFVFGTITRDRYGWKTKKQYELYQNEYEVEVFIDADDNKDVSQAQREAFEQCTKKEMEQEIEEAVYQYYKELLEERKDYFDEDFLNNLPNIACREDMALLVKPKQITVNQGNTIRVMLVFDCKWDFDRGMALAMENSKITEIGYEDELI